MSDSQPIGVALLGLGVVGSGVAEALERRRDALARSVGAPLELRKALVRDLGKPRPFPLPPHKLTLRMEEILDDPDVRVVVELMGGETPAGEHVRRALERGKHVVTANKELMAKDGPDLLALADSKRLNLRFEGAVGGAIPVIGALSRDLLANRVRSIHAIINGTTNFILTRMAEDGMDAGQALRLAQERGYAEADPANDVEGLDAAYKLAILATLAFHSPISTRQVYWEGISRLSPQDFRYARELGYAIKLLAVAKRDQDGLEARVHPALIPEAHILAKVGGVFNAVEVAGDLVGRAVFHGLGAGPAPTASAVLGDLVDIGRMLLVNAEPPKAVPMDRSDAVKDMSQVSTRYYLRLHVPDRAGVLAKITRVLGDLDISIASVIQKDTDPVTQTAEIVITTHPSREAALRRSLAMLGGLDVVKEVSNMIRLEELPS